MIIILSIPQIITNLIATLVIFVFAAFFVAAEFALVQTRPSQLEDMLSGGQGSQRKVKRALHMVHNLNEYLSTNIRSNYAPCAVHALPFFGYLVPR